VIRYRKKLDMQEQMKAKMGVQMSTEEDRRRVACGLPVNVC